MAYGLVQPARSYSAGTGLALASNAFSLVAAERESAHFADGPTSPSRALDTIYQNTGSTARLVSIAIKLSGAPGYYTAKTGAASPPATSVVVGATGTASIPQWFVFIVAPGHYYELDESTAGTDATLLSWEEWQL